MNIDEQLNQYCTADKIEEIYWRYKKSKVDELLAQGVPKIIDLLIANGATYEQVLGFDHPAADLPINETKDIVGPDGRKYTRRIISIPTGADGITSAVFENESNFKFNCQQIANRLNKGNYLFYPLREVIVPKNHTSKVRQPSKEEILEAVAEDTARNLSISSIRDAIVQLVLYQIIEPEMERLFQKLDRPVPVSYAYRKGKSAGKAARRVFKHIEAGYVHILDADLAKFFDKIPTQTLINQIGKVIDPESRVYTLIKRFIRVGGIPHLSYIDLGVDCFKKRKARFYFGPPAFDDPQLIHRSTGVPQGGVLSGLLANLYMHSFDEWVRTELSPQFNYQIRYVRYADDFVILTKSESDVYKVYDAVLNKIEGSVERGGLDLHMHKLDKSNPKSDRSKTRYVDVTERSLEFVGFQINPNKIRISSRESKDKPGNIQKFKARWLEALEYEVVLRNKFTSPKDRLRELVERRLRFKIYGRTTSEPCKSCGKVKMKRRGWLAFFCVSTDKRQIRQLEKWMRLAIYQQFRETWPDMTRSDLHEAHLPSLYREYFRVREMNKPCSCKQK